MKMMNGWIDDVLRFWFEELEPAAWFMKSDSVDSLIRERFLDLYRRLAQADAGAFSTARACLAAVIVLDQFPRNMFRGSAQAYAQDERALSIAEHAIGAGFDGELSLQQRVFLYLPFQHSEDAATQARSVELYASHDAATLDYVWQHKRIIDRFGRFPHRNLVLGRESTAEEIEFMKTHPGF